MPSQQTKDMGGLLVALAMSKGVAQTRRSQGWR
jgi:hypothetical protein